MREDRRFKAAGIVLMVLALGLAMLTLDDAAQSRANPWGLTPHVAGGAALAAAMAALAAWCLAVGCGALEPGRDERRRAALKWQALLGVAAVPLALLMVQVDRVLPPEGESSVASDVAGLFAVVVALAVLHLLRRIVRHEAVTAAESMARDPRPPVLYLRSFKDDRAAVLTDHGAPGTAALIGLFALASPEQELAWLLGEYGPVVAIGKPGEALPELGAARLYVGHDEWQAKVHSLMQVAGLVVMRVGSTPGVAWEVEQALRQFPKQRLLLVLIGTTELAPEVDAVLRPVLGNLLPVALAQPPSTGWRRWVGRPPTRIGALVGFKADGAPRLITLRSIPQTWAGWGGFFAGASTLRPSMSALKEAFAQLRPSVQRQWPARRVQPSRGLAVFLGFLLGHFGAHWFYLGHRRRGGVYVLMLPIAPFFAWCDAFHMLWMTEPEFQQRYGADAPFRKGTP
jgi:TM2 domain